MTNRAGAGLPTRELKKRQGAFYSWMCRLDTSQTACQYQKSSTENSDTEKLDIHLLLPNPSVVRCHLGLASKGFSLDVRQFALPCMLSLLSILNLYFCMFPSQEYPCPCRPVLRVALSDFLLLRTSWPLPSSDGNCVCQDSLDSFKPIPPMILALSVCFVQVGSYPAIKISHQEQQSRYLAQGESD